MKKPLYIFLHIPKTGGTTIRDNVEKSFEKNKYFILRTSIGLHSKQDVFNYFGGLGKEEREKILFIGGHFVYYGIHRFFSDRDIRYITFFREPIHRLISFYNHSLHLYREEKNINPWNEEFFDNENKISFEYWLSPKEFMKRTMICFLFSRIFGIDEKNISKKDIEDNYDKLKDILGQFYFIGCTEDPKDFEFVYSLLGINNSETKSNVSKEFIDYSKDSRYLSSEDYNSLKDICLSKCRMDFDLFSQLFPTFY